MKNNLKNTDFHADQIFTKTFSVDENISTEPAIHISQEAFPLCEADFLRIKKGESLPMNWAKGILLTSIGLLLSVAAKFFQSKLTGVSLNMEMWEWGAPVLGLILSLLLYVIALIVPNERKQVMKDIQNHFSEAPRRRHLIRHKNE
jgi:hypothetical protein